MLPVSGFWGDIKSGQMGLNRAPIAFAGREGLNCNRGPGAVDLESVCQVTASGMGSGGGVGCGGGGGGCLMFGGGLGSTLLGLWWGLWFCRASGGGLRMGGKGPRTAWLVGVMVFCGNWVELVDLLGGRCR